MPVVFRMFAACALLACAAVLVIFNAPMPALLPLAGAVFVAVY